MSVSYMIIPNNTEYLCVLYKNDASTGPEYIVQIYDISSMSSGSWIHNSFTTSSVYTSTTTMSNAYYDMDVI